MTERFTNHITNYMLPAATLKPLAIELTRTFPHLTPARILLCWKVTCDFTASCGWFTVIFELIAIAHTRHLKNWFYKSDLITASSVITILRNQLFISISLCTILILPSITVSRLETFSVLHPNTI